ncbi:MAG: FAD-dependent oxidoreductase [Opitutaceae bacterium]
MKWLASLTCAAAAAPQIVPLDWQGLHSRGSAGLAHLAAKPGSSGTPAVAYGFDPTPLGGPDVASTPATDRWGSLVVDENQMTTVPGLFAGGDSVRGPSLVVHAVRDARRAAQGIHCHLQARASAAAGGNG